MMGEHTMTTMLSAAIGNEAIFIAIAILLLAVNVLLTFRLQKLIKTNKNTSEPEVITASAPVAGISSEVVAAISAAVTAVLDTEIKSEGGTRPKFIVKQIKRIER